MNTKMFKVTTEIKIRRPIWRWLGYGDQPSKNEVEGFFEKIVEKINGEQQSADIEVRYMGAPGYYLVVTKFQVNQPYWRRLGFGDTTSRQEVKWQFVDEISTIAQNVSIIVEIVR